MPSSGCGVYHVSHERPPPAWNVSVLAHPAPTIPPTQPPSQPTPLRCDGQAGTRTERCFGALHGCLGASTERWDSRPAPLTSTSTRAPTHWTGQCADASFTECHGPLWPFTTCAALLTFECSHSRRCSLYAPGTLSSLCCCSCMGCCWGSGKCSADMDFKGVPPSPTCCRIVLPASTLCRAQTNYDTHSHPIHSFITPP